MGGRTGQLSRAVRRIRRPTADGNVVRRTRMQPQDGLHVLSVVQGADFRWRGTGKFVADELYVWLAEVPVEQPVPPPALPPTPASDNANAEVELAPAQQVELSARDAVPPASPATRVKWEVRPVKMFAQGNVNADSKQFRGNTPRLEIWFDQPETPNELVAAPAGRRLRAGPATAERYGCRWNSGRQGQ